MNNIYLVTGAAGHLGSVLSKQLIKAGENVRALVLPDEKHTPEKAELYFGDVRDKESIRHCFENLNDHQLVVIHCAGIVSIASKFNQAVYDVNVTGTRNIVDLCREYRVSKLIYVSSVHAIPEKPKGITITETTEFSADHVVGLYAKTKAEATAYILDAARRGLNACVVHPSGITGPYDNGRGHITTLVIDYYKRRLTSGVNGGYDFVDVRDVADGIIAACEKGRQGECYILSNRFFKISEILDILHEITGKRKIKSFLPLWFVKVTAPLAELYYQILKQPPLFTSCSIYTLNSNALFSHQKATSELGYTTRETKETLNDTINWLKENGRI
ncbi:NAD-dependent epimerase/dehydratase family protein [Sedimentibacter saalensis]|uniref:NAD-dependent epimerase/dehydratase family protein n=1 Tax=Sedimentibacter saalensis TaxID=130788 RepID=UPI0028A0D1DF|nr:NAD-dependent epimerase/dehydratase family protein [Sedimentibacter saalensis]